ncbi:RHS repeat domain-containing protein, partial [Streptomyces avermitilis]|uniref:RHS repeat domain-containing protein n=1 Tax=Streptomyces avermitilis TaxID=33903 RepID=UPI0033AAF6C2
MPRTASRRTIELKKNSDGTYTLTNWKSGSKDTYDANGTLTKVTDPETHATSYKHNSDGEVSDVTDAKGRK